MALNTCFAMPTLGSGKQPLHSNTFDPGLVSPLYFPLSGSICSLLSSTNLIMSFKVFIIGVSEHSFDPLSVRLGHVSPWVRLVDDRSPFVDLINGVQRQLSQTLDLSSHSCSTCFVACVARGQFCNHVSAKPTVVFLTVLTMV